LPNWWDESRRNHWHSWKRGSVSALSKKDLIGRKVAVLDEALADEIFGCSEPVGNKVSIGSTPFLVVGVVARGDSMLGPQNEANVYIPIRSWQNMFGTYVNNLEGSAVSREKVQETMDQAVKVLERRHRSSAQYVSLHVV